MFLPRDNVVVKRSDLDVSIVMFTPQQPILTTGI